MTLFLCSYIALIIVIDIVFQDIVFFFIQTREEKSVEKYYYVE